MNKKNVSDKMIIATKAELTARKKEALAGIVIFSYGALKSLEKRGCRNEKVLDALVRSALAAADLLEIMENGGDIKERPDLLGILAETKQVLNKNMYCRRDSDICDKYF